MNFQKLYRALRQFWWVARLRLWLKWQRLIDPALWHTKLKIKPENIVLESWKPERVHVTTNVAGERIEYQHSLWGGIAYFPFLESKARFTISVDRSQPTAEQIEFLRSLLKPRGSMWNVFQIEIFKHYHEYVYRQIDFYDSKGEIINDRVAPRIDTPRAMRTLLQTPSIIFDEHSPTNNRFDLCFPCTWQPVGMGVDVTVRDWQVVNIH